MMPKGIIKTPAQEKKWERAKDIAEEQGKGKRWPLIMHIFQQMSGMSKDDGEDKNVLIERALERQGRKTAMPDEVHQVLHSWWQENKSTALTPEQHERLKQIKAAKQKPGLKLVKGSQYIDSLYGALYALRETISEDLRKADEEKDKKRERKFFPWSPSPDHTRQELIEMKRLVDQGYHPREAAHIVSNGLGGRGEHRDFQRALTSNVKPTMMSDKMLQEMRDVAGQWLNKYHAKSAKYLEPEKNPVQYAAAQMKAAHENRAAKFNKEYGDFLASDQLKGLLPMARLKAVEAWKNDWKQKNPEYESTSANVYDIVPKAKEARQKHIDEIKSHLVHGSMPAEAPGGEEFESAPTSGRATAEHMGMKQEDEGGPQYGIIKDPSFGFAGAHRKFIESQLAPEVKAKQPHPAQQTPAAPARQAPEAVSAEQSQAEPQAEPAKAVIRRRASPEQVERMSRIDAAKMAEKKG